MTKSIYSRQLERLCELLAEARTDAGLTQRDLAERLKRPRSYIGKIEVGERRLDVVEFLALCNALEIDPAVILEEVQQV